jgi:hypothetical protein
LHANVHALDSHAGAALETVVEHELHAAPLPPHAVVDCPATQLPAAQQPPLHTCDEEHEVVHVLVDVLHAWPTGHWDAELHTFVHAPFLHCWPPVHAKLAPQPPQLLLSVSSLTHSPLQSVYPLLHTNVHALCWHTAVALAMLVVHASPHPPQFALFVVGSTHVPLQRSGVEVGHTDTQVDDEQAGVPLGHDISHALQLAGSLVRSTHVLPHRV